MRTVRLGWTLGQIQQLAERGTYDEREAVEVEGDLVPAGERVRDGVLDLGEPLVVERAVDGQMGPLERRAGANVESSPNGGRGVHDDNNARAAEGLRRSLTRRQH